MQSKDVGQRPARRWPWLTPLLLVGLALFVRAGPLPDPDRSQSLQEQLPAVSSAELLAFSCDMETCRPDEGQAVVRQEPSESRSADLTGDGVPEMVRLADHRIVVVSEGQEVWRSPDAWHVTDVALGDPNDDGRQEMMLALWKADAKGVLRSHPFIVGYRRGTYWTVWGGSAVAEPIQELEVGDVDGDGMIELVVLESSEGGLTISVWDWHGWGFNLFWRSETGAYRDLFLSTPENSDQATIAVLIGP
ncbi:MAG: hypothetical protein ACP5HS_06285 [Anaerolineae bacterium]